MDCVDYIHSPDVDCVSDVAVALFYLEVDIRWLLCIQVGCIVCLYDVVVVLILEVTLVVVVDCVIGVLAGHVILCANVFELDVNVNREVPVVDPDVTELNVQCELLDVVDQVVNVNDIE